MKHLALKLISSVAAGLLLFKIAKPNNKIQGIVSQMPRNPDGSQWPTRNLSGVTDITMHHSAGNPDEKPASIARYHINGRGWPGIAYHFVVTPDGVIYQTNRLDAYTTHNGFNNENAIGVCLPGNFETSYPTAKQMSAYVWLCNDLKKRVPNIRYMMGHREYQNETLCPGKNIDLDLARALTKLECNPKAHPIRAASRAPEQYILSETADN